MSANGNQAAQSFVPQMMRLLPSVFLKQAFFNDAFTFITVDGVSHNQTMMTIKHQDIPVVINNYDTSIDLNSGSSRFGPITEIIYGDVEVPFTHNYSINEAVDQFTINNNFFTAIGARLMKQAQSLITKWNRENAIYLSDTAGTTMPLAGMTEQALTTLFDNLAVHFTNLEVASTLHAKIPQSMMNALQNHGLVSRDKGSSVSIDQATLPMFKGFVLQAIPDHFFPSGTAALVYVDQVAVFGTGIIDARTMPSTEFSGVLLQNAGKNGYYCLEDNRVAIVRVTGTIPTVLKETKTN